MCEVEGITGAHEGVSSGSLGTIGDNIRDLRLDAGYKRQGDFAEALGVPQSRVSDWENDRYGLPDTGTLLKIAKELGVSIDRLLEGVDPTYDAIVHRDPVRHDADQQSEQEGAPAHVPAAARVELQRLRDLVARYEKEAREVRTVTDSLVKVALTLEEIRKAPTRTAGSGRRDRKAG